MPLGYFGHTQLKEKNYAYVEEEMSAIVELCRVGIVEELKRAGMG